MRSVLICLLFVTGCLSSASPRPEGPPPAEPLAEVSHRELFAKGVAYARRGDSVRAEQYLNAAVARGADEAIVTPVLVRVCIAASRFRAAFRYADVHLERHPDDWALRLLVADVRLSLGETARARTGFQAVLRQRPDLADAHYLLGVAEQEDLEFDRARQRFARYLELAPEGPYAAQARQRLERRALQTVPRSDTEEPAK